MIILDTDCISLIERGHPESTILLAHLESADTEEIATTIVNFEEQMRGWLAFVAKAKTIDRQVLAYERLNRFLDNYRAINVLPFEEVAAIEYRKLQARKIRIGTMDLKIAAIALAHDALLITRNISDFERIADLRLADWTR